MALLATSCSPAAEQSEASATETAADHEAAIRAVVEQWLSHVRDRNAAAIAALYTDDGALMPPGAPIAQGSDNIEAAWRGMMETPGFDLTFAPTQIVVASAGDMALDRGTYRFTSTGSDGPVTDVGKYVVVWRNVDGNWKAAADIFNSDGAPATE
jgi:uncharacterized protein (TIGR02246 family)